MEQVSQHIGGLPTRLGWEGFQLVELPHGRMGGRKDEGNSFVSPKTSSHVFGGKTLSSR